MRIAVIMNQADYEAREALLAADPDDVPGADAPFHEAASSIVQAVPDANVDLCVEADGPNGLLAYKYLYTMAGDAPGEEDDEEPYVSPSFRNDPDGCNEAGAHLQSVDDDGYCNECGHQDSEAEYDEE